MLAIRLRVRPCKARLWRSSSPRAIWMTLALSSCVTFIAGCGASSSLPFGPSTLTLPSASWIFTPLGTGTGCLPIRDMANSTSLPNGAEQLAAEPLCPRLAVTHNAFARAQDGNAEAIEHGPEVLVALVEPAPGRAGAIQPPQHALAFRAVLQIDPEDALRQGRVGRRLEGFLAFLVHVEPDLVIQDEAYV